jgi:hypothetical protein
MKRCRSSRPVAEQAAVADAAARRQDRSDFEGYFPLDRVRDLFRAVQLSGKAFGR